MGAAQVNYALEQGQTFAAQITVQVAGVPIPCTATYGLDSTSVTVTSTTNIVVGGSFTGPGIQNNTIITAINGLTLTLSFPTTAAGTSVACVAGSQTPVNLTGITFLFTAKTNKTLSDTDPTTVKLNWTETNTPLLGQTFLQLSNNQTAGMTVTGLQPSSGTFNPAYSYQVWMSQGGSLTPLLEGIIIVSQSISTRAS